MLTWHVSEETPGILSWINTLRTEILKSYININMEKSRTDFGKHSF